MADLGMDTPQDDAFTLVQFGSLFLLFFAREYNTSITNPWGVTLIRLIRIRIGIPLSFVRAGLVRRKSSNWGALCAGPLSLWGLLTNA
jgi:hypothetical protein